MGCKQSVEKVPIDGSSAPVETPANGSRSDTAVLKVLLKDANVIIQSIAAKDEEKVAITVAFLNTIKDILRQTYRVKKDTLPQVLSDLCPKDSMMQDAIQHTEPLARDEFVLRLVSSWLSSVNANDVVDEQQATRLLRPFGIKFAAKKENYFRDLYRALLLGYNDPFINAIFDRYSEGQATMSSAQFLRFLAESQEVESPTQQLADDKCRDRFGSMITRFNFSLFVSSTALNGAEDPQRVGSVWQDMTQPLPRYMVHTEMVDSVEELHASLSRGARAIVFHCHLDGDVVMARESTLSQMLETIRSEGFSRSTYPLFICFAPEIELTVELQNAIATELNDILGDELARGLMFDGATIHDPHFSPAALQRRILVMGSQAPLKPFVGFLVADMNRSGLGVRVTNVVANTPAAKAGLAKGDWLTHVNGEPIQNKNHLKGIFSQLKLGDNILLRKENLEDVKVVVGGSVEDSAKSSKSLSDLVFLKFCKEDGNAAPWDIHDIGATLTDSLTRREDLKKYFNFFSLQNAESETPGLACRLGVQFVCASRSSENQQWVRGMFKDNGQCGYLLKADLLERRLNIHITVVAPPADLGGAEVKSVSASVYGQGSTDVQGTTIVLSKLDDISVGSFTVVYAHNGTEVSLCASFPASVIRGGLRAIPAIETEMEGKVRSEFPLAIVCSIKVTSSAD